MELWHLTVLILVHTTNYPGNPPLGTSSVTIKATITYIQKPRSPYGREGPDEERDSVYCVINPCVWMAFGLTWPMRQKMVCVSEPWATLIRRRKLLSPLLLSLFLRLKKKIQTCGPTSDFWGKQVKKPQRPGSTRCNSPQAHAFISQEPVTALHMPAAGAPPSLVLSAERSVLKLNKGILCVLSSTPLLARSAWHRGLSGCHAPDE